MKTRIIVSSLLFASLLTLAYALPDAESRPFSNFKWDIDEAYHRDGHVQFVVQKGSENFLPVGIKGLDDVTVTLHPTINHDQTGKAKLPRGVDIHFEPDVVILTDGKVKPVKLIINVDKNAPSNLYDVQVVGTWKEEGKIPGFMGSSIRLHVGHDFGDGKIPVNMLEPPLKIWKLIQNDGGIVDDVPCRNDYVLVVKHDGSPACVKPETKDKLIERGWTSETRVSFCLMEEDPVCGADGKTYGNLCMLNKANVQLYHDGRCTSHDTSHENVVQPKKVIVEVVDRHYTEQVFPIRITEIASGIADKDKIQAWFFLPLDMGEKIRDWNFVTNSMFGIVDKNGDDAIDRSVDQDFGYLNDVSRGSQITCSNDEIISMKYRTPSVVEIKDNVTETYSIHSNIGFPPSLYKNETLKIASFFDQEIILPDHAILISNRSETCAVNHMGFTEAYYDEVVFQFTR